MMPFVAGQPTLFSADCTPPTPPCLGGKSQANEKALALSAVEAYTEINPTHGPECVQIRLRQDASCGRRPVCSTLMLAIVVIQFGIPCIPMGPHGFPWVPTGAHDFPVLRVSCDSLPHGGHSGRCGQKRLSHHACRPFPAGQSYRTRFLLAVHTMNGMHPRSPCFESTVLFRKQVHRPSRRCFAMRAKTHPNQEMGFDIYVSRHIEGIVGPPRPWPCLASSASSRSSVGGFSPDL